MDSASVYGTGDVGSTPSRGIRDFSRFPKLLMVGRKIMKCVKCEQERVKYSPYCRDHKRDYDREYYQKNKEKMLAQRKVTRPKKRQEKRDWLFEYLNNHPCVDCGETNKIVLEFDHQDSKTKKYDVSILMLGSYSLPTLIREVEKCDVRCANCHMKRTAEDQEWWLWKVIHG